MDTGEMQQTPITQELPNTSNPTLSLPFKKLLNILIFIVVFFLGSIAGYYFRSAKESTVPRAPYPTHTPSYVPQAPTGQITTTTPTTTTSQVTTITIKNSGSTNFPAATLLIQNDGSGTISYSGQQHQMQHVTSATKSFQKGTFNFVVAAITQISNVSQIPTEQCIKSISFGSTTSITYNGLTSGDLQCLATNAPQVYKDLASQTQKALTLAESSTNQ